jgi:hypothetical protein
VIIKPTKIVIAVAAYAVVLILCLGALVVIATGNHQRQVREHPADYRPTLSVAVGDRLEYVPPVRYCENLAVGKCDPVRKPVRMPAVAGRTVTIALPPYISERPWFLTVQYYFPASGNSKIETQTHLQPGESSIVLPATADRLVAAVDIQVPSAVQDPQGNLLSQAQWAVDTLPEPAH